MGDAANPRMPGDTTLSNAPPTGGVPMRGLRRLSRREYNNVVRDLLGDTTQPANQFGIEVYVNGFDNGSDGLTVQGTDVDAFQAAAEALAARAVATNLAGLTNHCDPKQSEPACVDAFLQTFTKKAYRRPPTPTELERLRAVHAAGAAAGGFSGGIQLTLEAILQSPAFLYREELGAPDPTLPANTMRLTDYEVASELSFLITGSMPDDSLFAAAESGKLKTADDFRREAARLLGSPAAKLAFRSFLHQWLSTDQLSSVAKDGAVYPTFNSTLAQSMSQELDQYFDQVLWTGSGSLKELLTSTQGFVDPGLASVYNVKGPATGFAPIALDGKTRQGILTRAGFLAAHADADSSGPIARGVFVLNAVLCDPPPPPPANVPPAPPASGAVQKHQTTRQRFDAHLNQSFCASCHSIIDGVGFGFEEFDGIGAYRTTENGSPVDTSGSLKGTDADGAFMGASELASKLVTSQDALRCFVKQVYRFAMGQEETGETARILGNLQTGFSVNSRVTDVFMTLVGDSAFAVRTTTKTGP